MARSPRSVDGRAVAALAVLTVTVAATACSSDDEPVAGEARPAPTHSAGALADDDADFPNILEVEPTYDGVSGTWAFSVTVSSPYDTPDRYADGWRVVGPEGAVYGVHTLAHDHRNEQPFTRRQSNVEIPDDVDEVTIEGRDQANGFGGGTVTVDLAAARS